MKCWACDAEEQFQSMKEMHPERELLVCIPCGAVMYRVEPADEGKMRDYYRFEYRPQPTWMNLLTSAHKLQYVAAALKDWLEKQPKGLVCGDVGCAIGYIPNWLKRLGHEAYGSEYTVTFRRFAEHFYGIPIHEELPEKEYDLITIYHVLEHMIEPDKKLAKYAGMLKPGGRMLVACPQWFDVLEEASGSSVSDFTHLFHKDHINVFSEATIKRVFAKAGLVPEWEDHRVYGQTYLLRKGTPEEVAAMLATLPAETCAGQIEKLKQAKEAIDLFKQRKYREAINVWPKFPEAWIGLICDTNMKSPERQVDLWEECRQHLESNLKTTERLGMWFYQREEWAKALECFEKVLPVRPHENLFIYCGWTLSHLGRTRDAMAAFKRATELYPMKWQEAMDWICREACSMPNWQERAEAEAKEKLWKEHQAASAGAVMDVPV